MEAGDVQVRRVHPDEWAAVRDVRLAALADAPDAFGSTLGRELGYPEARWRSLIGDWPWFLAWSGGTPAGLVAAVPAEASREPAAAEQRAWHLVSMWVSPQARGRGAADLLVRAVLEQAEAAGALWLTLWVAAGNARARGFYRRMGFTPTGRRQVYPREGATPLDEEELARPVRSAAPPTTPR